MFMMRVFLNSEIFFSHFDFWSGVLLVEHVFIFGLYYLAKRFMKITTAWLVVGSSLVIGTLRTFITTSMAINVGLEPGIDWSLQLITGALFELVMVAVWANVNGAYRDHQAIVRRLNQTKDAILGYRENAELILAEEQESLQKLTRDSLLPQIQLLENAIGEGNIEIASRWGVAQELKGLIYNQVRPLSDSLSHSAKSLKNPAPAAPSHIAAVLGIPKEFRISNSLFPTVTAITLLLGFVSAPLWILDQSWTLISGAMVIPYYATLAMLKKWTSGWPKIKSWFAIPLLVVFAIVPVLPAYIVAVVFYPVANKAAIYGSTVAFLSLIVVLSLALLDSFDYGSRAYRDALVEQNHELTLEMTLFEQQVWAARKRWSLIIHGTVQSALTAALTRLNAPDANKKMLDQAKKDLDRAIAALTNPPTGELKFAAAIKELIETWQGVCDVKIEANVRLKKILANDTPLCMCLNEILKEAISNAVRHGDASKANIKLTETKTGIVEVIVSNDGTRPVANKRKGLGSSMLDELTLDWQLTFDPNGYQTVLIAHLPFSKAQY